jgi:CheY-like chemotaxis protein
MGGGRSLRLPGGDRALVVDLDRFVPGAGRPSGAPGDAPGGAAGDVVRLVVLAEGGRRLALAVARFLGEWPLVQEALDPFLKGLRGVTGTAMLEDGRLAAILNVVQVFQWVREERLDVGVPAAGAPGASSAPPARLALVAEDSDLTRSLVAATLARGGFRVVEAVDGKDALERMRAARPDVLVTDLEMPAMDGIELIRRVRAEPSLASVPVLVFSTRGTPTSKREAAEAGANAYVVKREFEEAALLEAVRRLLPAAPEDPR